MDQPVASKTRALRDHGIYIKVTESDYSRITEMAARDSRPLSSWIYTLVRKELARVQHNESQNRARALRRARAAAERGK